MTTYDSMEVKAQLAMTASDHQRVGSTPAQALLDNPGKTLAETMSDKELRTYILDQVAVVTEQYQLALAGDDIAERTLRVIVRYIILNIPYLRTIGRLPAELESLDPATSFSLPAK